MSGRSTFTAEEARVVREIGLRSNPLLLWGIAFELVFAAAVIYVPALQGVFGTTALSAFDLLILLAFPFVVWGADEARRMRQRRNLHVSP